MTLHDHIYSNFNISISFKPSITFAGSTGNLGSVRGRSLKAGRIRRLWRQQCLVLVLSFFFLTICFFFHMLYWISTKLGQNDQWVSGYKNYQQFDLKGHLGVTGVKKVNHVKNIKTALISKLIMSSCRQLTKLQKSQWWPCHTTLHKGVKGQNVSYFQTF